MLDLPAQCENVRLLVALLGGHCLVYHTTYWLISLLKPNIESARTA